MFDRDLPAHGRFWIDADTGHILRTELRLEDTTVRARIVTSFRADERLHIEVPLELRDDCALRTGGHVSGDRDLWTVSPVRCAHGGNDSTCGPAMTETAVAEQRNGATPTSGDALAELPTSARRRGRSARYCGRPREAHYTNTS